MAEMGVAMREDGGTVGVFSPKKVRRSNMFSKMKLVKSYASLKHFFMI